MLPKSDHHHTILRTLLIWSCVTLFFIISLQAQDKKEEIIIPDSIKQMEYDSLYKLIYDIRRDQPKLATQYCQVYLDKAKRENDSLRQTIGYRLFTVVNQKNYKYDFHYIDSAIAVGKHLKDTKYPALLHIHKGILFEEKANFKKALDYYLIGLDLARKRGNIDLELACNHNIALIKRKFGHYGEAKRILKTVYKRDAKRYKRKEISLEYYHLSLVELINTYRLTKQIDSAYALNNIGIKESEGGFHTPYFILNRGILLWHQQKYTAAIKNIESVVPLIEDNRNALYFSVLCNIEAYLYLGKSYDALEKKDTALYYYKKIDSIAEKINYVLPETHEAYLGLKKHYEKLGDKDQQLIYMNKLLRSDSILKDNYNYLRKKLKNEYDAPRWVADKEALIQKLESAKESTSSRFYIIVFIMTLCILGIGGIAVLNYRKRKLYTQRFQKLVSDDTSLLQPFDKLRTSTVEGLRVKSRGDKELTISPEIVEKVLKELARFEKNREYLKPNLTTSVLARKLKTNAKYLSKIINYHKGKNITQYLNDLRIEYIIEELKINTKYRNYTIKALAKEAGFNLGEVFSKAFYKKTGIYPSYFIKQLEKKQQREV